MDISRATLFQNLAPEQLRLIEALGERRHLADGEMLFAAGEENHHLYIVLSGSLEVRLRPDSAEPIKTIEPGETIGEISVVDGGKTSAWLRSAGPSELLAIHASDFWRHLAHVPGLMRNLTRLLIQRFRDANEQAVRSLTQQLQYEHLQKELATAANIQMDMLPRLPLFPQHRQIDMHAALLPAKVVGGDLFDAFKLDDDRILVAVGDVSGKGMPAALFMMRTLTLLRTHGNLRTDPDQLLPLLNGLLGENNETSMFVTLYVAILDLNTGKLHLLNAGHLPPLVSRQGGAFEEIITAKGMLLGIMPGGRFVSTEITLRPGDRILFYTDGVTEAENPALEQFGVTRTQSALARHAGDAGMQSLVEHLVRETQKFSGEAEQSDDITILGLRYLGSAA